MDKKMLEELQKMQKQIADFEDRPSTLGDGLADLRNNKLPVNQLPEGVITGDVTADNVNSGAATEGQALIADGEGGAEWGTVEALPEITAGDEGKVLKVDSGAAIWGDAGSEPEPTEVNLGTDPHVIDLVNYFNALSSDVNAGYVKLIFVVSTQGSRTVTEIGNLNFSYMGGRWKITFNEGFDGIKTTIVDQYYSSADLESTLLITFFQNAQKRYLTPGSFNVGVLTGSYATSFGENISWLTIPNDASRKTYDLKCVNGTIEWTENGLTTFDIDISDNHNATIADLKTAIQEANDGVFPTSNFYLKLTFYYTPTGSSSGWPSVVEGISNTFSMGSWSLRSLLEDPINAPYQCYVITGNITNETLVNDFIKSNRVDYMLIPACTIYSGTAVLKSINGVLTWVEE